MPDQANENKRRQKQVSSTVGGPEWNQKQENSNGPATEAEKEIIDHAGTEETSTNYRQTP